jgi:ferritin-like metal-binding protein YciE
VETEGGPALQDAIIVATCQKISHFMIAAYRSARSRARHLGASDAASLLQLSLEEKEQADERLTGLGETLHIEAARLQVTAELAAPRAA